VHPSSVSVEIAVDVTVLITVVDRADSAVTVTVSVWAAGALSKTVVVDVIVLVTTAVKASLEPDPFLLPSTLTTW